MPRQDIPRGIEASTGIAMPAVPSRRATIGSLTLVIELQHDSDPVSHDPPPLATGVAEAATPVTTVNAAIKEARDLGSIMVKSGWRLW
jgi:hypothetical protein